MSFFSRLSDIISCNLNEVLQKESDPLKAIKQVISEIEEGLAGARRSVNAAGNSEKKLLGELEDHRLQIAGWGDKAREAIAQKREDLARSALLRKLELEDLLAGLEQQHAAAVATREHLTTTLRAIEARLAEARRREQSLALQMPVAETLSEQSNSGHTGFSGPKEIADRSRADEIEKQLEALRREMGK